MDRIIERVHKQKKIEQYQDMIGRLYPELVKKNTPDSVGEDPVELQNLTGKDRTLSRTVTFQVTDACNLCCTYCYQINKGVRRMSFETAKKFVDLLISGEKGFKDYVDPSFSPAIILEFIGGEPFLEVELIDKICDYFFDRVIEIQHPWATKFCISICSNGVLYRDPKVQKFLNKWKNAVSFSVTVDGDKDLHDSCRIFPDGKGSYDLAYDAAMDWMARGYYMGSKITIAPGNLPHLSEAIKHFIGMGYEEINANCVYEEGWNTEHATEFYYQLKSISDYMIDNNLVDKIYLALFMENFFKPKDENDLQNWCGGTGAMLSCDPDGKLYPCIRYMESSLGTDQKPLSIGDLEVGLGVAECDKNCIACLNKIDRRSQSTDECFNCPIGEGCSWCSAYNYQVFGTPDKRATFICIMHKARALANVYFWNKWYKKTGRNEVFVMHCPKEWALEIIPEEEYSMLVELAK